MKNELISIIIPIYNVSEYLDKCLASVVNQTYSNLEIIAVNDGSTDNSHEIIRNWAERDKRIVPINKKNGGLSSARNCGLDIAKGSYIMFIDSDDFIEKSMVEILYYNAIKYKRKISICNRYYYYPTGEKKLRFADKSYIKDLKKDDALLNLINNIDFDMSAWAKLYSKELWKDIRFPTGKLSEDYFVMYNIFSLSDGVVYTSRPLLYYLQQRGGSITQKNRLIYDYVEAAREQMEFIKENYPRLATYAESAYCLSYFTIFNKVIQNGGVVSDDFIREMNIVVKSYSKNVYKNIYVSSAKKIQLFIFKYFRVVYPLLLKLYKKGLIS